MKVSHQIRRFESGVDAPVHKAQILATPGMFKIMYDKLYTRKEEAIVRELLANAWDAHVEAGTTSTPIKIHLPTTLEPWFEIQDFGTGLAPEHIHRMYDYGATSKDHSSDYVGGFGIGAKTPFCYTDQFTITSRHGGKLYTYQVFLHEDGAPGCMLIGEQPYVGPAGLTIHVPIGNADFNKTYSFRKALARIVPFIPTPPACNEAIDYQTEEPLYSVPIHTIPGVFRIDFFKRDASKPAVLNDHEIVMGIVPYRIGDMSYQLEEIAKAAVTSILRSNTHNLLGHKLAKQSWVLHADIDTFPVGAPRESLEQDDQSRAKIAAALDEAYTVLIENGMHALRQSTDAIEWMEQYRRMENPPNVEPPPHHADIIDRPSNFLSKSAYEFNAAAFFTRAGAELRSYAYADYHIKKCYRLGDIRRHGFGQILQKGRFRVYVCPSDKNYPTHAVCQQVYQDEFNKFSVPSAPFVYFVRGDIAKVRQIIQDIGFDWDVVEQPNLKKKSSGSYGRAKYWSSLFDMHNDNIAPRHYRDTLDQTIDNCIVDPETTIIYLGDDDNRFTLRQLVHAKVLHPKDDTTFEQMLCLHIPPNHNKVRADLLDSQPTAISRTTISKLFSVNVSKFSYYQAITKLLSHNELWTDELAARRQLTAAFANHLGTPEFQELQKLSRAHYRRIAKGQSIQNNYVREGMRLHWQAALNFLDTANMTPKTSPDLLLPMNKQLSRIDDLVTQIIQQYPGFKTIWEALSHGRLSDREITFLLFNFDPSTE